MEVVTLNKKIRNHKPKAEVEEMIKKLRKEDERLVKGQFEFTEAEGGTFEFSYRIYPGEIVQYKLTHGEICEIPYGLVKHLNGCKKKIKKYANIEQSAKGAIIYPKAYDTFSRVKFVPVDYL
jgi:hypothetical protein